MHTGFTISVVASVLVQTTGSGLDTGFNDVAMHKMYDSVKHFIWTVHESNFIVENWGR